jgi:signal transduction histidine kinase
MQASDRSVTNVEQQQVWAQEALRVGAQAQQLLDSFALDHDAAGIFSLRGQAMLALGNLAAAMDLFNEALAIGARNKTFLIEALLGLAKVMRLNGDFDSGRRNLNMANTLANAGHYELLMDRIYQEGLALESAAGHPADALEWANRRCHFLEHHYQARLQAQTRVAEIVVEAERTRHRALQYRAEADSLREQSRIREQLNAELERRVDERTAELEHANKELQTFSYTISHNLNGPARRIAGFSAILLTDFGENLTQPVKEHLHRISHSAAHMGELIDDILALSRASAIDMHPTQVDLTAMARTIAADLRVLAPDRRVDFLIDEGMIAQGDQRLLYIALDNLLGNAWKYTATRESARIEFGRDKTDAGATVFHVRDNGVGFDTAHAARLFEPFERLHGDAEIEGSGIGLATVRRVINRHHGTIWAEAKPAVGATFFFTIATPGNCAATQRKVRLTDC